MHVRRELRAKITEQLRIRLKEPLVSRQTGKIRLLVVVVCLLVSSVLFYFAFDAQRQIAASVDTVSKWSFIAKVIFSGIGAVGFVGYAVAWLRRIYLDDVQLERSLERYALDLDRASWSIETLMEMSKTEGAEIPTAWVQGVCNDLFSSSKQHEDPTPLQALGAMMDVAAGAEIGPSGTKITLNRRGAKAIAESAK